MLHGKGWEGGRLNMKIIAGCSRFKGYSEKKSFEGAWDLHMIEDDSTRTMQNLRRER